MYAIMGWIIMWLMVSMNLSYYKLIAFAQCAGACCGGILPCARTGPWAFLRAEPGGSCCAG